MVLLIIYGLIVYHDNDIQNGTYSAVGTIKRQGEIFNRSGTGGDVSGDHLHLETGKGQVDLQSDYLYHFRDNTHCKRIVPDKVLFVNDTTVVSDQYSSGYNWIEYDGGITPPTPTPTPSWKIKKGKFPWQVVLKKRNENFIF